MNKSREKPKIDTSKLYSEGVLVATKKLSYLEFERGLKSYGLCCPMMFEHTSSFPSYAILSFFFFFSYSSSLSTSFRNYFLDVFKGAKYLPCVPPKNLMRRLNSEQGYGRTTPPHSSCVQVAAALLWGEKEEKAQEKFLRKSNTYQLILAASMSSCRWCHLMPSDAFFPPINMIRDAIFEHTALPPSPKALSMAPAF